MARESTNFQWNKLLLNWGMIIVLTVISLLKGSGDNSPIGVTRCSGLDWALFALLQVLCVIFIVLAVVLVKKEYKEKVESGYNF